MRYPLLSYLILIFLALLWGSSFILIKKGLEGFEPVEIAAIRLLSAGLSLAPFLLKFGIRFPKKDWPWILAYSVIGNGIPAILFPLAETGISSALTGILNSLSPIFTLVTGMLFFRSKSYPMQILGVLVGFGGATLLVLQGGGDTLGGEAGFALLVVLAALMYGTSANVLKSKLGKHHPIKLSAVSMSILAVPSILYLLFSGEFSHIMTEGSLRTPLFYICVLGIMNSAFALVLFNRLIQMTDAVFGATIAFLIPVVAIGWGWYAGESISVWDGLGTGIILLGLWLVNRQKGKRQA